MTTKETKIQKEKEPDCYGVIKIDYSTEFIFPYEDSIQIMSYFRKAKKYVAKYNEEPKFEELGEYPQLTILTTEKYKEILMKNLLLKNVEE